MRHYIANLHTKSDGEKKRFALFVSGVFTLVIFTVWSLATFGGLHTQVVVKEDKPGVITLDGSKDASPFSNIGSGLASSFAALKQGVKNVTSQIGSSKVQYNSNGR